MLCSSSSARSRLFERFETICPEPFIVSEPLLRIAHPRCVEPAIMGASCDAAAHKSGLFQHPNMLRRTGKTHLIGLRQLSQRPLAIGQPFEACPGACRQTKRGKPRRDMIVSEPYGLINSPAIRLSTKWFNIMRKKNQAGACCRPSGRVIPARNCEAIRPVAAWSCADRAARSRRPRTALSRPHWKPRR
jgi:hypothetical protein